MIYESTARRIQTQARPRDRDVTMTTPWLIEAPSKAEVVKWTQRCPAEEGDVIEVRQVFDEADFAIKK